MGLLLIIDSNGGFKGGVSVIFFLKKFILALLLFSNNFLVGLNTEFISYQSNQIH